MSHAVKLGLQPKTVDPRTIQYRSVRAPGPWRPPPRWSWDAENPGVVTTPMFANDQYGCCVIAAQAHATLRMEYVESGAVPPITADEVVAEYFRQSGGVDSGLYVLPSLSRWRRDGLPVGGSRYRIHSFLEVNPQVPEEFSEAAIVGLGIQVGARLPLSAADQMNSGQAWDLVAGPRGEAGSWGGHMMYVNGYTPEGVDLVTWGKVQFATWRWVAAYCDQCFVVIDAINRLSVGANIDREALFMALGRV